MSTVRQKQHDKRKCPAKQRLATGIVYYSEAEVCEAMEWTRDVVQDGERLDYATILARIRAARRKKP